MAKLPSAPAETSKADSAKERTQQNTREPTSGQDKDSGAPREERIRNAAYRRYLERGGDSGDSVADWLQAEGEINAQNGN
jgi:hypothetical protein